MKWCGRIGFMTTVGNDGIYSESIVERFYSGDFIRNSRRRTDTSTVNSELSISNQIRIIADPYATQNFHAIRYAEYMGALWTITDVEVQYPGLLLTLGGVYNEQQI